MDNYFSKLVAIILLVTLLCIVPAFYINILTDFSKYNYRLNDTKVNLDKIVNCGRITDSDFLNNDDVDIAVLRNIYMPDFEEEKTLAFTKYTISNVISKRQKFNLENGDVIIVTLKNDNNFAEVFFRKIFDIKFESSYIRLAGVVKNESY